MWDFCEGNVSNLYRITWNIENEPELVVALAESALDAFRSGAFRNNNKYDLVSNNCEHLATACKIGKPKSIQVQQAAAGIGTGLVTTVAIIAGVVIVIASVVLRI